MAVKRYMRSEKVAPHLLHLKQVMEMSTTTISQVSGVPKWAIDDAISGRAERLPIDYARALLKVKDGPKRYLTSPLKAQRQLRALAVHGYTIKEIATTPGMPDESELIHIRHGSAKGKAKVGITAPIADAIDAFYQAHKDTPGTSAICAARARTKGWEGPVYWEDRDMSAPEEAPVDALV